MPRHRWGPHHIGSTGVTPTCLTVFIEKRNMLSMYTVYIITDCYACLIRFVYVIYMIFEQL